jgi:sulfatase modifying factor 1
MNALRLPLPRSLHLAALVALALAACNEQRVAEPAPNAATPPSPPPASAPPAAAPASAAASSAGDASPADAGASAVDAGADDAGADAGAWTDPGCPEGMARAGRFCIDRWEAHLVKRGPAGEIVSLAPFDRPAAEGGYEARSEPGVFPQAYISRVESARACKSAGKRLCSMKEWRRACRGKRGSLYPYGNHWQARKCNSDRPHLLSLRFGPDARRWRYEDFNDPTLDQEPGFLEKTGAFNQCGGDHGVYDLVGNLHEWVSDTVDDALIEAMDAEEVTRNHQPSRTGNGVFLGGFFSTHQELGPGCKFTTVAHEPTYHDYSTGFRCCASAPLPSPLPSSSVTPPDRRR